MGQKCSIGIFLGWNFKKLMSYLKSVPSNLSNSKASCKKKKILKGVLSSLRQFLTTESPLKMMKNAFYAFFIFFAQDI